MQIAWEKLLDLVRDGLPALCEQHWAECQILGRALDMDWARYGVLEHQGIIRWIGIREDGRLVGYASICISRPLHHQHEKAGLTDTVFLSKDRRKGWTGVRVVKRIMTMVGEQGVECFTLTERLTIFRTIGALGKVLKRLGFEMFERSWIIKLGAQNG